MKLKVNWKGNAWRLTIALLALVAVLAGLAFSANDVAATSDQAAPPGQSGVISSKADGVELTPRKPWTRERMRAAKPYPLPSAATSAATEAAPESGGTPGAVPAKLPERAAPRAGRPVPNVLPPGSGLGPAGYSYAPPFTRYEIFTSYTDWPYKTIGKLFFSQQGSDYVCSASSIGNYAIWTAGHCVHAGNNSSGGWSYDVSFVPAYLDGDDPFGTWNSTNLWVPTEWYKKGSPNGLRGDMGGAILYTNNKGEKISDAVGALGFAWNRGYILHWNVFGYPAASPFNGERLNTCQASFAYSLPLGTGNLPKTQGIGCDMTSGASGGPWIWKFGTDNYLNGNNSYRRSGKPLEMNSPNFATLARGLYDALVSDTP